jgi:signal transduction histidine kinase
MVVRSIRTRLVASYMLVGLVSVAVAGVLAQSLVARVIGARQTESLRQTAVAIADQAQPWVAGAKAPMPILDELTRTSSFLADAHVTILDRAHQVLADSGPHDTFDHFVFLSGEEGVAASVPISPTVFMRRRSGPLGERVALAPGAAVEADGAYVDGGLLERAVAIPAQPDPGRPATGGVALRIVVDHAFETGQAPATRVLGADEAPFESAAAPGHDGGGAAPSHAATVFRMAFGSHAASDGVGAIRVPIGDPARPAGYVQLREAGDARATALATTRRSFTIAALFAALVAGAFGVVVARGMHAPLAELTAVTAQMSAGDLHARARVQGRDEIAQLGGQFNTMADALAASFAALEAERDALRAFIADASHELRTPITALSNFNELIAGAAADDTVARAEFVAESRRQIERLRWLTTHLLDLSRLDAGLVALERETVDVGELLDEVAEAHAVAAAERGVALTVQPPADGPLTLPADRARLSVALSNLVDNAVKYTPVGGTVTLGADTGEVLGSVEAGVEPTSSTVRLWVADTGVGLDPADAPHVWDRFFRGRRGTDGVEGTGLGLAIVQSIARAHGGTASVAARDGGGTRFEVRLRGGE